MTLHVALFAKAAAALAQYDPTLPPEAASVFAVLSSSGTLTAPGIARRINLAQSTVLRHIALLILAGLVVQDSGPEERAPRYQLTDLGRSLAVELGI